MCIYEYGNLQADIVLVQPVGDHDLAGLEAEVAEIQRLANKEFRLLAVKVDDWNQDLSPWFIILAATPWRPCFPFGRHTRPIDLRVLLQPPPPYGFRDLLII